MSNESSVRISEPEVFQQKGPGPLSAEPSFVSTQLIKIA
jgi:hypothetical protein